MAYWCVFEILFSISSGKSTLIIIIIIILFIKCQFAVQLYYCNSFELRANEERKVVGRHEKKNGFPKEITFHPF